MDGKDPLTDLLCWIKRHPRIARQRFYNVHSLTEMFGIVLGRLIRLVYRKVHKRFLLSVNLRVNLNQ